MILSSSFETTIGDELQVEVYYNYSPERPAAIEIIAVCADSNKLREIIDELSDKCIKTLESEAMADVTVKGGKA